MFDFFTQDLFLRYENVRFFSHMFFAVRFLCQKQHFYQMIYWESNIVTKYLAEHLFTNRSALYRIPLELVKNRKLHNEMNVFIYKGTFANKDFENKKLTLPGVVGW